ncbi:unnamed protein product, partial [Phaeothamnion confervicola]
NLRSRQVGYRYVLAVVAALASGFMAWQIASGQLRDASRFTIWVPIWLFYLGILQARSKTCALLAAQGMCDCEGGMCPVAPDQRAASRQAAISLISRSLLYATVTCAAVLFLVKKS